MLTAEESEDDDDDIAPILVNIEEKAISKHEENTPVNQKTREKVPLTIITGFLGAGKTTLIQHILSSNTLYQFAIIENEYAENGTIESLILKNGLASSSSRSDDIIELANGCLCCSLKSNLVETIEELLTEKPHVDYILLEMSGLANPAPIATTIWFDQLDSNTKEYSSTHQRVYLDGIIALIDVKHFQKYFSNDLKHDLTQQLVYADSILFNKVDLISPSDTSTIHSLKDLVMDKINPTAVFYETSYSKIDTCEILNLKTMTQYCTVLQQPCAFSNQFKFLHSKVFDNVSTITLSNQGVGFLDKLNTWLATILWPNQDEEEKNLRWIVEESNNVVHNNSSKELDQTIMTIFRIKGIASVFSSENDNSKKVMLIQAIDDTWEIYPVSDNIQESYRLEQCQVIIIGRNLDERELNQGFSNCFIK